MSNCSTRDEPAAESASTAGSCCPPSSAAEAAPRSFDWLLWGSGFVVAVLYVVHLLDLSAGALSVMAHGAAEMVNTMWWGVLLGIVMVGALSKVPREFVLSILGPGDRVSGVVRATLAGLLLDLCNHGILMVAAKLYERGASTAQVMAFLVASPWNSLSLTIILVALIGFGWTVGFVVLSMLVALATGCIFLLLERRGVLPANTNRVELPEDFEFVPEARQGLAATSFDVTFVGSLLLDGLRDSRMVLRWLLFGIVLAVIIRALISPDAFADWFGPTLLGLGATMVAATIIEVCSEGSVPLAGDLFTRAGAPGNAFAFLMAGAATDYTEVMVLRDVTRSWKVALFLPLVTVPQIAVLAFLLNLV
ncbi:MAG: permease [Pseudomonadaceae bacterium]|nr:permease [Pseudomonadaceae bacterium]